MYAVIESGGRQFRVQVGDTVRVERLDGDPGAPVVFDRVLMVGAGDDTTVGGPTVDGAAVRGSILGHGREKKVRIYTFKRRQNSNRRRKGHRQDYTAVKIEAIES
ncbi:MAG TPA: 50S ribosomal protein L21 [Candidatus Polarisedimenticolaceae bacterium]|nr:50S ribosomal protein L21 [Candidatus Polarisedimenticolaceae bacterium]